MSADGRPTVLLTGATGFVGSHVLRRLVDAGFRGVALKRSSSDTWRIADLLDRVDVQDCDVRGLDAVFASATIDAVVHTATTYGRHVADSAAVQLANVGFPSRLLDAAANAGVRAFLNTDSFTTKSAVVPASLAEYVRSKIAFREYGERFAHSHRMTFVNVRLEHVYGPVDNPDKFFPFLLREFLANRPSVALTPCQHRWDVINVDDVAEAFVTLLKRRDSLSSSTFEVGFGRTEELADVVRAIHQRCEARTRLDFGARPYEPGTVMVSCADNAALRELGWRPATSLRAGIDRLIAAARANPASIAARSPSAKSAR